MKQIYKVKKEQLTYSDFISFIMRAVNDLVVDEGISPIAKDIVFKLYFAMYYLDVDLPEDMGKAYDIICNIDYDDYRENIAWNQFIDLRNAFENKCKNVNKMINKDINSSVAELVQTITNVVKNMNEKIEETDINSVIEKLGSLGTVLNGMEKDDVLELIYNKLTQKSETEVNETTPTKEEYSDEVTEQIGTEIIE